MGMRQRLGIARCLLADPELLILDEPMNGLDPAGILDFRNLIRALVGEGRTVVLSSHILDEVEKTCDYVAIVDRGEIVTMGPLADLQGEGKPRVLIGVDGTAAALEILAGVPGVSDLESENGVIQASVSDPDVIPELNRRLVEAGHPRSAARTGAGVARGALPRDHVTAWRRGMTAAAIPQAARVRPFGLARADLLKLRRRRGLFWTTAGLIVGPMVIAYGILAILHAVNPDHHGPAGGIENLGHGMSVLVLRRQHRRDHRREPAPVRTTSASGVFRELVVTGRSRLALFGARIPGGLAFVLSFAAVAYAHRGRGLRRCERRSSRPSHRLIVESGLWVFAELAFYSCSRVGLASLIGSRAYTIGILLAWRTVGLAHPRFDLCARRRTARCFRTWRSTVSLRAQSRSSSATRPPTSASRLPHRSACCCSGLQC